MLPSLSSKFDSLPARPPTPPREISKAIDDAIAFLDDSNEVDRASESTKDRRSSAPVSIQSPPSSQDVVPSNAAKKVGFSPDAVLYEVSRPDQSSSPSTNLLKRSPLSKDVQPLKSILKHANNRPPPTPEDLDSKLSYFSPEIPGSFAKMIQSVIHQLASQSRTSRLDAYLALNGALKAYESVPDASAMVQKMALIMQFLTRDIAWKDADGKFDTNVATQALKLTMAILADQSLAHAIDDDFKSFLIDRTITAMEQADMPKSIIKIHMYLLYQQRFHSSIMTSGRAERILAALQAIEDRCTGNSIFGIRLVIYTKLIHQAPRVMLARMREWLEHVFHGMLSSIKDVRIRAVETCTRAGLAFGTEPHATRALHEMLATDVEDGQTYCDYLSLRLLEMLTDAELGPYVPQIWSAVILFFRSKRCPLDNWSKWKTWVSIIQKCLNSSDLTIRYQATLAWNKLVFTVMPDSTTSKQMLSLLKVPIISSMNKRGADKLSKQTRHYGLDSYHNLLHYALRPSLSYEEHDNAWEIYVNPTVSEMLVATTKGRYAALRILHGLLNSKSGVWDVDMAFANPAIKPEELPRLDPRWVRSRMSKIVKLLEPVMMASMWSLPDDNAALDATWHALMRAVADAGSQEVKTSNDLKEAIAALVNMFRRLWRAATSAQADTEKGRWLQRYISLIDTTVATIGAGPFAEEILSRRDDNIEVAPTPSHKPSKHHGPAQSSLVILLGQFYHPPSALEIDESYEDLLFALLRRFTESKSAPEHKIDLLNRSLAIWTEEHAVEADIVIGAQIWAAVARTTTLALQSQAERPSRQDSQTLGHELRNAVTILSVGLSTAARERSFIALEELFDATYNAAKRDAGEGGVVLALLEPMAKALLASDLSITFDVKLRIGTRILTKATWPKTRQVFDQARKALWGMSFTPSKPAAFDPFDQIYPLISEYTNDAYNVFAEIESIESGSALNFVSSAITFLTTSPLSFLPTALRKVQNGFVRWVEDDERKTASTEGVAMAVINTWSTLLGLVKAIPAKNSALLQALEPLIVAGFISPHRDIVNETILFWNESFGNEGSLEYPETLEKVLRARMIDADINLPSFPESNVENVPASLPDFFESQKQSLAETHPSKTTPAALKTPRAAYQTATRTASLALPQSPATAVLSPYKKASRTPGSATPKARLRHDDSQIEFAPIESSPLPPIEESQLLTDHQKDIMERQHENAQLYPGLSSSPMAQSTALQRPVVKRLDFTSDAVQVQEEDEAPGTPTGLPDGNGLMSDDPPSSPTPSSTKDTSHATFEAQDDQDEPDLPFEPPSSPPKMAEDEQTAAPAVEAQYAVGPDDTTVDITDILDAETSYPREANRAQDTQQVAGQDFAEDAEDALFSDAPSDCRLPNEQLQHEEEVAAAASQGSHHNVEKGEPSTNEDQEESQSAQKQDATTEEDRNNSQGILATENKDKNHTNEPAEADITRVEDSFVEPGADEPRKSATPTTNSPKTNKKRKRQSSSGHTTKRRSQQSPLKRWTSRLFGQSQQDDDEDIGEEIVVASSQRSSSPPNDASQPAAPAPRGEQEASQSDSGEQTALTVKEEDAMPPPFKRGRGRPRKSETPTPSLFEVAPSSSLKRRASTISDASTTASHVSTSLVKDTPAPPKARKQRKGADGSPIKVSQSSQQGAGTGRSTQRSKSTLSVMDTEMDNPNFRVLVDPQAETKDLVTPEKQLEEEQAAAVNARPIATPRSILSRLRNALTDLKGMMLGSQEEREYDDVLFEFRREVFEAGRRGREE